jgi:hypothetical protein
MFKLFTKYIILFSLLFNVSCNFIADDITDFVFLLPDKEFTVDSSQFDINIEEDTIPSVACPGTPTCAEIGDLFFCNTTSTCAATVDYSLKSEIISLKDEVEAFAVVSSNDNVSVEFNYIQMQVNSNTLNFDLPPMDIYIAPQSVTSLHNVDGTINPDVTLIGTLDSITAGTTGIHDIVLTNSGEGVLTEYVSHPDVPFYLFVSGSITFEAGDSIPQGALTTKIHSEATASIN